MWSVSILVRRITGLTFGMRVIPSRADGEGPRNRSAIAVALYRASRPDGVLLAQANQDFNCEVPRRLLGSG